VRLVAAALVLGRVTVIRIAAPPSPASQVLRDLSREGRERCTWFQYAWT